MREPFRRRACLPVRFAGLSDARRISHAALPPRRLSCYTRDGADDAPAFAAWHAEATGDFVALSKICKMLSDRCRRFSMLGDASRGMRGRGEMSD